MADTFSQNVEESSFFSNNNCNSFAAKLGMDSLSNSSFSSPFSSSLSSADQIPLHLSDNNRIIPPTSHRYFMNIKSAANGMLIGKHTNNNSGYLNTHHGPHQNHFHSSNLYRYHRYDPYQSRSHMLPMACSQTSNYNDLYHQNYPQQFTNQQIQSNSVINQPPTQFSAYQNNYSNLYENSTHNCNTNQVNVPSSIYNYNIPHTNGLQSVSMGNNLNASTNQFVTLQISNLDYSLDESSLRSFLLSQLKPITPVISLIFEGSSFVKVTVPDIYYAKQVVANLHRKKIGHKRMVVSYTRDSSLTEIHTLRCQVAGLLKDVPYCTLPMYKFRELFQSRFKTSISVLDLYKMQDICNITSDKTEEKYISLNSELVHSIEQSPLMESLQESVPYCSLHFKRDQHKGWAEQELEQLPNIFMTINEIKKIIYPLLKTHSGDIPVSSLSHCINGELGIKLIENDNGVNLEHLVCCVNGIQITSNSFGIKILGWLEPDSAINKENENRLIYSKSGPTADPLYQISREVVELIKMSPKATMKFNRFIPAYHNHFGKQCRVADYGYTKLIELFEALSSVVQIMGDGENRQITLTHRTQIRRFTTDLLRILRSQGSKSILLSQLPQVFSQSQNRNFEVTDYGVCSIVDILDGLVHSNIVVVTQLQSGNDILISIPKRKQTSLEIEKTCIFASEVVELFRNAPQYTILFQKFVRSYHYHFGFQCRLSDYGFLKLADLMESIQGIVELEFTNDEDKKIFLSPKVARRVFSEQLEDLIKTLTNYGNSSIRFDEVLKLHKNHYGYEIQSQTLGYANILDAVKDLPYVEIVEDDDSLRIICHHEDQAFRNISYRAGKVFTEFEKDYVSLTDFISSYLKKHNETISENLITAMKHFFEIKQDNDNKFVGATRFMKFLIKIVKLLEKKSMNILEIKGILNFGTTDCFEFGYPNLYTLLNAYSDIFSCELGATQERSEISLIVPGELINESTYNYNYYQKPNRPSITNGNQLHTKNSFKINNLLHHPTFASFDYRTLNKSMQHIEHSNEISKININYEYKKDVLRSDNFNTQHQLLSAIAPITLESNKNNFELNGLDSNLSITNIENKICNVDNDGKKLSKQLGISIKLNPELENRIVCNQNKENLISNNFFNGSFNSTSTSIDLNLSSGQVGQNSNLIDCSNESNESSGFCSALNCPNSANISNGSYGSNSFGNNSSNNNNSIEVDGAIDDIGYFTSIWDKNQFDYLSNEIGCKFDENEDIFNLSKMRSIDFNNKSKSDSTSKNIPVWFDPVWKSDNNQLLISSSMASPKMNAVNNKVLDLSTYKTLPMAISSSLSQAENMDSNMFLFSSPDKKI